MNQLKQLRACFKRKKTKKIVNRTIRITLKPPELYKDPTIMDLYTKRDY